MLASGLLILCRVGRVKSPLIQIQIDQSQGASTEARVQERHRQTPTQLGLQVDGEHLRAPVEAALLMQACVDTFV